MLLIGSKVANMPILSLHVGGPVAEIRDAVIDPEDLRVVAYTLDGPVIKNDPEVGNILDTQDVREISNSGLIVDSVDRFTTREDVVRFDKIMDLGFHLIGLKVVTTEGKKLGKIIDYTLDSGTFMIYQLIVQRPFMSSLMDPELTINRSQIVEVDDFKVTIKHEKAEVKTSKEKKQAEEEFVPNFTNPFRKPAYTEEDSIDDSSSNISE